MIVAIIFMLVTLVVLLVGVLVMSIGGKINKRYSKKLMLARVIFQFFAIVMLAIMFVFTR